MATKELFAQLEVRIQEMQEDIRDLKDTVSTLHDDFIKRTLLLKIGMWFLGLCTTVATSITTYHLFH